ncbi:MAG: hypothetical protein R3F11_25580 [Verrucomicrobiales bacterium]
MATWFYVNDTRQQVQATAAQLAALAASGAVKPDTSSGGEGLPGRAPPIANCVNSAASLGAGNGLATPSVPATEAGEDENTMPQWGNQAAGNPTRPFHIDRLSADALPADGRHGDRAASCAAFAGSSARSLLSLVSSSGTMSLNKIRMSNYQLEGDALAKASRSSSDTSIGLMVIGIIVYVLFFAAVFGASLIKK